MAPMSSSSLPPGFRFHPTDEELVSYYLERKITGRSIELHIIPEVDLYRHEPWDLPDKSLLPSKDMEWYFYSPRDRKYPNGTRTNRATRVGYWKATRKDRPVTSHQKRCVVGVKKTLVYYRGRAPLGIRTNWVMHEYRLIDSQLSSVFSSLKDLYSLCRVFKKEEDSKRKEAKEESVGADQEEDGKVANNNKARNCEASSSDLTQGTHTETGMVDEANSAANYTYSLGIMDDPSNLFQDIEVPIYESMHDDEVATYKTIPNLEHLEMEDYLPLPETKASLMKKPEIISGQCVLYNRNNKDCIYGTLEEIISLCSSQDLHNFIN